MKRGSEMASCNEEERDEAWMEKTSSATMEDRDSGGDLEEGGGFGVDGDDLMLDINGDDLFFEDDTFPSLPDFPCLSSPFLGSRSPPSASACLHAKSGGGAVGGGGGGLIFSSASTSSSSSSSPASWPFLQPPLEGGSVCAADMRQQQPDELADAEVPSADGEFMMLVDPSLSAAAGEFPEAALDILDDMDNLLDMSSAAGPWDPFSIFPAMGISPAVDEKTASVVASQENPPPLSVQEGSFQGAAAAGDNGARARGEEEEEDESSDQDLSKMFLDWLKSNRDSISPEDLRNIKLKCSTIDCAARRLGGGKQAKMQLVKLILTWVQNNHLQKKRRKSRHQSAYHPSAAPSVPVAFPYHHHQPQPPQVPINPNPNPNHFDYSGGGSGSDCTYATSWMPYSFDISTGAPLPGMMASSSSAAAAYSGEIVVHPGPAAPNYCYSYNSSSGSNMVVDGQPFSPPPDYHPVDTSVGAWPPQFATAPAQFAPFPCASAPLAVAPPPYAVLPNQFSGHPAMYPPQAGTFSATKEARKKRMASQRRHAAQRNQKHVHHLPHSAASAGFSDLSSRTNPVEVAGGSAASAHANQRNWVIWSNLPNSSSNQMNPIIEQSTDSSNTQKAATAPPAPEQKQAQHQNSHRNASSTADQKMRLQGLKSEKNLKFLLQKVLKQSDVGSLGRIVLPKKEAETHLPELDARDGISIQMEDIGTNQVWNLRYRYWPNNRSRMYLLENTGDFVRTNGLQEGDFIVLYSDVKCSKYMIRGVKVRHGATPEPPRAPPTGSSKNFGEKAHMKVGIGSAKKKAAAACGFFFDGDDDDAESKEYGEPSMYGSN